MGRVALALDPLTASPGKTETKPLITLKVLLNDSGYLHLRLQEPDLQRFVTMNRNDDSLYEALLLKDAMTSFDSN